MRKLEALVNRESPARTASWVTDCRALPLDRQTEALQVYERARQAFADELGLEPSESLKRLERADSSMIRPSRLRLDLPGLESCPPAPGAIRGASPLPVRWCSLSRSQRP